MCSVVAVNGWLIDMLSPEMHRQNLSDRKSGSLVLIQDLRLVWPNVFEETRWCIKCYTLDGKWESEEEKFNTIDTAPGPWASKRTQGMILMGAVDVVEHVPSAPIVALYWE